MNRTVQIAIEYILVGNKTRSHNTCFKRCVRVIIGNNISYTFFSFHSLVESHIQLFQLRLSTSKAEKSNTSAKGCWESLTN